MKSVIKVAVSGFLALAIGVAANAVTGAQLQAPALNIVKRNEAARQFMTRSLGVSETATLAQVQAAIGKLAPAEAAAVISVFNNFASQSVDAAGNMKPATQVNSIARSMFMDQQGQTKQVAALLAANNVRQDISTAAGATCSIGSITDKLAAAAPEISKADIQKVVASGDLQLGNCSQDGLLGLAADPAKKPVIVNSIKIASCILSMGGYKNLAPDQLDQAGATCFGQVKGSNDNAQNLSDYKQVRGHCHWLGGGSAAAAM